jgi:hypothetical protein
MNRDEKLSRPTGLPPAIRRVNGRKVACPSETGGGTWIALNESGATLALINWYSVANRVLGDTISRGEVVKCVSSADSPEAADARLHRLPLEKINPFRLIGIFPAAQEVFEWRWDVSRLIRKMHPWKSQQWISSGYDEKKAQRVRSNTFERASDHWGPEGRLAWLRHLHRSHSPHSGPFSICMHRPDAATVSYTEISVSSDQGIMNYHPGSPCESPNRSTRNHLPAWRLDMAVSPRKSAVQPDIPLKLCRPEARRGTSAEGGYTTAGDLMNFAGALMSNKLLKAEALAKATRPQFNSCTALSCW